MNNNTEMIIENLKEKVNKLSFIIDRKESDIKN